MVFSLYDALDKSRVFTENFICKLPLGSNTSVVVESKKASGYEIGILRNKAKNPEKLYESRYDIALPEDLVSRADMVVYLVVLGLRDYFKMIDELVSKVEAAMIGGIRIGRHPKASISDVLNSTEEINKRFGFMIQYTHHLKEGIESYLEETYYPTVDGYLGLHNPFLYRNVVKKEINRWGEDKIQYMNIGIPRETNGSAEDYIYITMGDATKPSYDFAFGVVDDRYYFGASIGALECDSLNHGLYHYIEALSNMATWTKRVDTDTQSGIRQVMQTVMGVNHEYSKANEILLLEKAFDTKELFIFYTNMLRHHMSK